MMKPDLDGSAGRRAARQFGLLMRREVLAMGFTSRQVDVRLRTGRWRRVAPQVYAVTGTAPSWQQQTLAATMSVQRGVASHLTAAALWSLGPAPLLPHMTVPPGSNARCHIARVHRAQLDEAECTTIGRIPVTRLARTLLDCASVTTADALTSIVDSALDSGKVSPAEVRRVIEAMGRPVRGGRSLLRAMEPWTDPIAPGSPAEARLLRRLSQWGFAAPERQHVVVAADGRFIGRVDVAWVRHRVGIEYDGGPWHGPRRIRADEVRHHAITQMGWHLVHADRLDLRPGDDRLRKELGRLLADEAIGRSRFD